MVNCVLSRTNGTRGIDNSALHNEDNDYSRLFYVVGHSPSGGELKDCKLVIIAGRFFVGLSIKYLGTSLTYFRDCTFSHMLLIMCHSFIDNSSCFQQ